MTTERSSTEILQDVLEIPGVNGVVIVGRDGFIIESVGASEKADIDTVGASIALILNGIENMEEELKLQSFNSLTLEAKGSMVMCAPVGDALLTIMAPDSKTLGMIRLRTSKLIPELAQLF